MKGLALEAIKWARENLSSRQVCGICLFTTVAVVYTVSKHYVRIDEITPLRSEIRALRSEWIEDKVDMYWRLQCHETDDTRKAHYYGSYREKQRDYRLVTGSEYQVPRCDDL